MSIGIITGASRGLGLALTRALAARGWTLVVDARDERALVEATRGLAGVVAVAGDVTDPRHRERLVAAAGDGIDLVVNNASALGPSPQPALAAYPLEELRRVLEVNVLAPLALVQAGAAAPGARRGRPRRQLRRRRRGVPRLGRLRLFEGGAGPPDRDPRDRAPGAACLRRRPRRHAHPAAPGGVPGRGHLRPAAAGGQRARAPRARRGDAAERPLPDRRAVGGARMSTIAFAEIAPATRAAPGRGAARRDARGRRDRADALRRPPAAAAPGRPARRQHVGDAARRAARDARRRRGARAPLDAARRPVAGSSSCAPRSSGRCVPRRSRATWTSPAADA